jgi:protein-tyrosine phosphatase
MASTFECVNFRDVADFFPELQGGLLYRGGSIAYCTWESVRRPATVINLRYEADELKWPFANYIHCPIENSIEKYDTSNPQVAHWLADVIRNIASAELPIMIHCRSGRDRTGVVMAVLLRVLIGVDNDSRIVEDYMITSGAAAALVACSLEGLDKSNRKSPSTSDQWIKSYFRDKTFPVEMLRRKFRRTE